MPPSHSSSDLVYVADFVVQTINCTIKWNFDCKQHPNFRGCKFGKKRGFTYVISSGFSVWKSLLQFVALCFVWFQAEWELGKCMLRRVHTWRFRSVCLTSCASFSSLSLSGCTVATLTKHLMTGTVESRHFYFSFVNLQTSYDHFARYW
jgi:hypothetical protein